MKDLFDTPEVIEATNLDYLFCDQINNFAHLITVETQTKSQFVDTVKRNYSTDNPRTALFVQSIERSVFNTIRLNRTKSTVLFNQ
jgi:hypothetical protein